MLDLFYHSATMRNIPLFFAIPRGYLLDNRNPVYILSGILIKNWQFLSCCWVAEDAWHRRFRSWNLILPSIRAAVETVAFVSFLIALNL